MGSLFGIFAANRALATFKVKEGRHVALGTECFYPGTEWVDLALSSGFP